MPLPNRVDRSALFTDPARGLFSAIAAAACIVTIARSAAPLDDVAHGSAAGSNSRGAAASLGKRLQRAVLPRRADRARRRSSSLLRMPARRRERICRCLAARRAAHRPRAAEIDRVLHAERSTAGASAGIGSRIDDLPDGAFLMFADEPGSAFAVRGRSLLRWSPPGYIASLPRPRADRRRRSHPARQPGRACTPATGRSGIPAREVL